MKKGRGAQINPINKFETHHKQEVDEYKEFTRLEGEKESNATKYLEVYPKSIVNKVDSPDVPMDWSMNPYQGCEHGCVYCYARPTHEYWGYNSGLQFESTILIKRNAVQLLEEKLNSRSWKASPIMLSGNTDCYQPIERKEEITREILKLFLKYKHPVGIITKNALILRDLDVLSKLAKDNLVKVNLSITTLNEELRRRLEPRTSSGRNRLEALRALSDNGVPTSVMMAPIIPGLNSDEVFEIFELASKAGAISAYSIIVRLNGPLQQIFTNWLETHFSGKKEKVLSLIKQCHAGNLNDSRFKKRMKGEGAIADSIHEMAKIAKKQYFKSTINKPLNRSLFKKKSDNTQIKLF